MQPVVLVAIILGVILDLMAARLRERVVVTHRPGLLLVRNQRAALRLDGVILVICLLLLIYALLSRSAVAVGVTAGAAGAVVWRLIAARRSPAFAFDRTTDSLRRGHRLLCRLSNINGLDIVPKGRASALLLRFRDSDGLQCEERVHTARAPQIVQLRAVVAEFLALPSP